ncbi:MMPL family transporter [Thermoflavimicrobium dichotomicum]|uniref:Putative drug exporter of the RND superfamily n=1 Tax=Thermoflavimicrobium dichotomicum TaxID=46223 RepID=A0A1I3LWW2_9BACL|nr:MMPL family transporter [Thermoflavimicrobium dichotomicum]SFI89264.1 putative drug exporter of the RND superfamily [Thermoflavimicrobium dichotomicum]
MFRWIAQITTRHPWKIVIGWMILLAGLSYFALQLSSVLAAGGFKDPDSESIEAQQLLEKHFPDRYPHTLIVLVESKKYQVQDERFRRVIKRLTNTIAKHDIVRKVETYDGHNQVLISKDKKKTFIKVGMSGTESEANEFVPKINQELRQLHDEEMKEFSWWLTGGPALAYGLTVASKEEVTQAEMIAIPALLIILLLVLRSVVATLIPLVMSVFALGTTMAICYFIAEKVTLNVLLTNSVSMIGLGVIVDYCLFIVSRFRQELEQNHDVIQAVQIAVMTAGRAVFFSGLTVAVSLSSLFIPNIMVLTSMAIGGVTVVIISVLIAMTLLPAILALLGRKVNLGLLPFYRKKKGKSRWLAFSYALMRRPVLFLIPTLCLLLLLAWPVRNIHMQVPVASSSLLPPDDPIRTGFELLLEEFGQGEVFPVEVVLKAKQGDFFDEKNLREVEQLTKRIEKLPHVEEVTSLTNWKKDWSIKEYQQAYKHWVDLPEEIKQSLEKLINPYQGKQVSFMMVAPKTGPDHVKSHQLVEDIRQIVDSSSFQTIDVYVGGLTAIGYDFDQQILDSLPYVIGSVMLISFVILVLTFRSLLIPVKALLLNSLVMLASLGALVYFFVGSETETINSVTPIVLFAVLFGLSMDYEVLIISRIRELYDEGKSNEESVAQGIAETAVLVNGAALIMIAVFVAFAFADISVVAELGFGLAVSIFLDATLVRSILVPVTMRLFGKINWWLPFVKQQTKVHDQVVWVRSTKKK